MEKNIQKDIKWFKALSLFEGVCFFVAGICALMSGGILGWISGVTLAIMACMSIAAVFFGGDSMFLAMGVSIAEDENADDYIEHLEELEEDRK